MVASLVLSFGLYSPLPSRTRQVEIINQNHRRTPYRSVASRLQTLALDDTADTSVHPHARRNRKAGGTADALKVAGCREVPRARGSRGGMRCTS